VVVEGVALDVGLVDEVEAVLVAEVVPALVVGVVREPDRVEVVALHDLDVADHVREVEGLAVPLVVLVAVHALDEHAVPHLDPAEADPAGGMLHRAVPGRDEAHDRGVEGGILMAPDRRIRDGKRHARLPARGAVRGTYRGS
jgi:hypothetical protein